MKTNKLLSVVLTLCVLLAAFSLTALAADGETYSIAVAYCVEGDENGVVEEYEAENLQNAINEIAETAAMLEATAVKMTLQADVTGVASTLTVPAGTEFTLDLAGHTLEGNNQSNDQAFLLVNGKLTLTDSVGTGKICSTYTGTAGRVVSVVGGELTVAGGTITTEGMAKNGSAVYAGSSSKVTVADGTIYADAKTSNYALNIRSASASVTMTGGTVRADGAGNMAVYVASSSPASISGGTISGETAFFGRTAEAEITGGTFLGSVTAKKGSITGGIFNTDVSAYVSETAGCVPGEDGNYTVVASMYAAKIGTDKYETLAEAIAAAKDGNTVTLLADTTEDVTITGNITLDLGTKTLTNTGAGKATLTVAKGATATVKNGSIVGGASYYTIQNNGTATLEDVTATAGNTGSSMIDSWGTLTITSGTYTGGLNVVKSEEGTTLNISGGTFTLEYATDGYTGVIFAYGTTTITGGEFIQNLTTTGRWNHPQVILAGVAEGYTSSVKVTGGSFTNKMSGESIFRGVGKATSDNFEVSGGSFNKKISDGYCADGFIPTKNADGTYGVKEGKYVAQIGSTKYETLDDAVRLAAKGKTIKLLDNLDISATGLTVAATKTITLDLNGHSLKAANTNTGNIKVLGKLTLCDSTDTAKNGTGTGKVWTNTPYIYNEQDKVLIAAMDGGTFTMESGLIDTASSIEDNANYGQFAVSVQNENADATVIINGGHIKAGWYAVAGNGSDVTYNGNITVNGGILESVADYAIYHPHTGTTTVNGGVIFGAAGGISLNRGKLIVNDGTITSKGTGTTGNWGDGTGNQQAAAINVNAKYETTAVEIKGGKITAEKDAILLTNGRNGTVAVSGGSFSSEIKSEYCAAGFVPAVNADGTYGVKAMPVAKIGTVEYATLAEAIAAAKDGDTVTLTADINTPETSYYIQKSLTIDLGGKTLTGSGYDGVFNIEGENAAVRIKNGKIVAVEQTGTAGKYTMAVWACAAGCEVTLEDLDVIQQITHTDDKQMDMIYTSKGTIIINSGRFESGTPAWTLNCKDSAYKDGTAKIIVNGGTFVGYDPRNNAAEGEGTSFVAPGVGVDAADGSFTAKTGMTAQVVDADGNSVAAYAGHYDAIAAAKDGEKVILLSDRKNFVTNTINANITIDLNGKTLSVGNNNPFFRTNGEVTIQNGTIDSQDACVIVNAYNKLTLKNVKITGVTGNNGKNLVNVCSNAEVTIDKDTVLTASGSNGAAVFIGQDADANAKYTLNVYGKVIRESKSFAISGNGSYKGTTTINIYDGAEVKSASVAIYHPQAGVINVNGGLVEGYCAIGIKSGTLNINGGTVRGTADDHVLDDSNSTSGTIIYDGSAIVVDSRSTGYAGNVNINVTGGTVESCYSTAIREIGEQDKPNMTQLTKLNITGGSVLGASQQLGNVTNDMLVRDISSSNVSVSGGTFNHAVPETYCADGFIPTKNADGTYGVKAMPVAKIGTVEYATLAEAIAAATRNSTVTLLADTKENVTISTPYVTLDLNGHTLNGSTGERKPALTITARVTVKDSSAAKTGTIMREDTAENSGVSSHYVIDVQGSGWLTFESGNVKNNSGNTEGKGAALVRVGDDSVAKYPGLNIKGGTFTQDNFIVIKVDRGDLFLNGGTLNSANSYAVENWHRATIKGGTVNGPVAAWTYSDGPNSTLTISSGTVNGNVLSVNYGSAESKVAKVEITGGTVNGKLGTYIYSGGLTETEDTSKATIGITGGTFANDPTKYVVEGATVTKNSEGKFGVAKAYLAKVGDTSYYTMDEAFKAQTASGEPVVLLRDYTTGGTFSSGSINRTVDLNEHTWTYTGTDVNDAAFEINYPDVTLTVKNGTVVSGSMVGLIPSAMGGTIKYDNSGLVLDGVTATANGNSGIETNGNNTNDTVTLKNSTLNVPNGFGIYFPSSGTLTLDNSTVNAKTMGVQVCAGSLSINEGSAVTVTGDAVPKAENDGAIQDGAAISVVNRTGYKGLGTVTVSGGKFTAKEGNSAIKAYDWANATETAFTEKDKVAVSGGSFSSEVPEDLCAEGYVPAANDDGTYGVKEEAALTDYVMIGGINGFADKKFATFEEAYTTIKPVLEALCTSDALGQGVAAAEDFDALFTDRDANGNATLTYTINGNVVYDETSLSHLLTMGRSSSHYSNGRHLINFRFVGATGRDNDTLTVNSNMTLPYEWWGEKVTTSISFENLTITGTAPNGLYPSQAYFEGIDFTVDHCTLKGIKIYNCSNVTGTYTITNSTLDGTGAAKDAYAIHLQGNETAPLTINIKNNTISSYDRGINIDQNTATATIEGNTISIQDSGRSCIQLTRLAATEIKGNTLNLTGGNAITLHELLAKLAAAPAITVTGNEITGEGYLIYDDAMASGTPLDADKLTLTYENNTITPAAGKTISTTEGVKGSNKFALGSYVNGVVNGVVGAVGLSDNMMIIPRGLADGKYTMLILAAIDSLDYAEVGFKVMVYNDGKVVSDETMYSTTTVYTSVKDGAGKVWKPDDSELGDTACKYLFASTMEIAASDKDAFTLDAYVRVVPYATDYDGNVLVKNTFNIPITYFFN